MDNLNEAGENDGLLQISSKKTEFFTVEEKKLLLKLINLHFDVLRNKKLDSVSTQLRSQAWEKIHKKYLENKELVRLPRTLQQLKKCWENMNFTAKRGDPMSKKLLLWGKAHYKLLLKKKCIKNSEESNNTATEIPIKKFCDFEVDEDIKPVINISKALPKEPQVVENQVGNNTLSELQDSQNSNFEHCGCDELEKNAKMDRVELYVLEKEHKEELHKIQMELLRDRINREKELHGLYVHEMSLKIQNERRKAESLEKKLKLQC